MLMMMLQLAAPPWTSWQVAMWLLLLLPPTADFSTHLHPQADHHQYHT